MQLILVSLFSIIVSFFLWGEFYDACVCVLSQSHAVVLTTDMSWSVLWFDDLRYVWFRSCVSVIIRRNSMKFHLLLFLMLFTCFACSTSQNKMKKFYIHSPLMDVRIYMYYELWFRARKMWCTCDCCFNDAVGILHINHVKSWREML
jgi:hypothetical protein